MRAIAFKCVVDDKNSSIIVHHEALVHSSQISTAHYLHGLQLEHIPAAQKSLNDFYTTNIDVQTDLCVACSLFTAFPPKIIKASNSIQL